MRIKAAVVEEAGQSFVIDEIDLEEPRPNEVEQGVVIKAVLRPNGS